MANPAKITERGTDGVAFEALIPASQPGDVFPAGTVVDYAGSAAPTGWLICDGSAVSRATYPNLFAALGTTYGAGDGSTTFGIPDCRGKVAVAKHSSGTFVTLGGSGGEETHQLTQAEMAAHTHSSSMADATPVPTMGMVSAGDHSHTVSFYSSGNGPGTTRIAGTLVGGGTGSDGTAVAGAHTHSLTGGNHSHSLTINNSGSDTAHNNLQPYIVLNKIIRAY